MTHVVSTISFGTIKPGDTVATFNNPLFAAGHYWVQRGWAYVKSQ